MGDFPDLGTGVGWPTEGLLTPWGDTPYAQFGKITATGYANTTTVLGASKIIYQPALVVKRSVIYKISIRVQTQNGNVDVGIYDWGNKQLVNAGTTAVAAAGVQTFDITDTTLTPGWYKLAIVTDSATAVFRCSTNVTVANGRVCGFQQEATAIPLPATGTPVAYATAVAPMIAGTYRTTF